MRILVAIAAISTAACASAPRGVSEAPVNIRLSVDRNEAPADGKSVIKATAHLPRSGERVAGNNRVRFNVREVDSGSLRRAMGQVVEAEEGSAVLNLETARPGTLVVQAIANVGQSEPVEVEFKEPELPANACKDPEYMRTKPRPLDKMTDREFQAYLKTYERLSADERTAFHKNDLACNAYLAAEAELAERKTGEEATEESMEAVDRPFSISTLAVGIPLLASLVWTVMESIR
jgi:hypothetical protein